MVGAPEQPQVVRLQPLCARSIEYRPVHWPIEDKQLPSKSLKMQSQSCSIFKSRNSRFTLSLYCDPHTVPFHHHSNMLRRSESKSAAHSLLGERGQKEGHLIPLHLGILLYSGLHGLLVPLDLCVLFKSALEVLHKFLRTAATPQQGCPGTTASQHKTARV